MIWISVISFVLIIYIMSYAAHKGKMGWIGIGIVVGLLILLFSIALAFACLPDKVSPSAIDVYRGSTTLEITYKDGNPVDSVVVYKDDYLKNLNNE